MDPHENVEVERAEDGSFRANVTDIPGTLVKSETYEDAVRKAKAEAEKKRRDNEP